MFIIETSSAVTLTVAQIRAGVVVEINTGAVNITLPALSAFDTGDSGWITVLTRSANAFTVLPDGTDKMMLVAIAENKKLVSPASAYATATIVLTTTTSGWVIVSAKDGASMGTTGFSLATI